MKKRYILFLLLLTVTISNSAQQTKNPFDRLLKLFETFQYHRVITLADSLLNYEYNFTNEQIIEIYRVKGISEYSLLEEANTKKSFLAILNLNHNFELDPEITSPKIISFFNNVKSEYLIDLTKQKEKQIENQKPQDTLYTTKIVQSFTAKENLRKAMMRSLVMPGWGQIFAGEKTKGYILTSLGTISLGSMLYFIFNANQKQDAYLSEKDSYLIAERYNDYNNAYRLRNASIISFTVIWLYSQIDLLFFTDFEKETDFSLLKLPLLNYDSQNGIQLYYSFSF